MAVNVVGNSYTRSLNNETQQYREQLVQSACARISEDELLKYWFHVEKSVWHV